MRIADDIDLDLKELGEDALPLRVNSTLIEQRAHAMMLDSLAGETDQKIALRYGISPDVVKDMIRAALEDCLSTRQHLAFLASSINKLLKIDVELKQMDQELPLVDERKFQRLDSNGNIRDLVEEVSNVSVKIKIKSERRQNVLATKTLLAVDTGEVTDEKRDQEIKEIIATLTSVSREVILEFAQHLSADAKETGGVEAERELCGAVIQIEPELHG